MRLFAVVLMVVVLAGCGQPPEEGESEEPVTTGETTEEDPTQAPPTGQIEPLRLECQARKAEEDGFDVEALGTQIGEAIAAKQFPKTAPPADPEIQQAISEGKTIPDILEGAGYTCTDQEVRELQDEAREQAGRSSKRRPRSARTRRART